MDNERMAGGVIGALVGSLGGYLLRRWQERKTRRELALLRRLTRAERASTSQDLERRYQALRKEHSDD